MLSHKTEHMINMMNYYNTHHAGNGDNTIYLKKLSYQNYCNRNVFFEIQDKYPDKVTFSRNKTNKNTQGMKYDM